MVNNRRKQEDFDPLQPIGKWLRTCFEQQDITEKEFGRHVGATGVDGSVVSNVMRLKRRGNKLLRDVLCAAWEYGWIASLDEAREILMDNPPDLLPTEKIARILKLLEEELTKRNEHIPQDAPLKQYNLVITKKDKEALELFVQLGLTIIKIKKALGSRNIQEVVRIIREEFALYDWDKVTQAVECLFGMINRITDT